MKKGERMTFVNEYGDEEVLYVQEMTTLRGISYMLVTESEDLSGDAYIFRESGEEDDEIMYDVVDDEQELNALADIFKELIAEDEEDEEGEQA